MYYIPEHGNRLARIEVANGASVVVERELPFEVEVRIWMNLRPMWWVMELATIGASPKQIGLRLLKLLCGQ